VELVEITKIGPGQIWDKKELKEKWRLVLAAAKQARTNCMSRSNGLVSIILQGKTTQTKFHYLQ
jgi:hypothetical protein